MLSKRQDEIIQITMTLIANKGIQGFTIKNLSQKIGISEPAIYRHFSSKTEILLTMLSQFENFKQEISENIHVSKTNSFEKINTIFDKLLSKFIENPPIVSIIFSDEIFSNEKKLSDKISKIMDMNNLMFTTIIKDGQQNNEIRNDIEIRYIVLMIMGALRLLVKKWEKSDYSFDLKKEGQHLFTSIKTTMKKNNS